MFYLIIIGSLFLYYIGYYIGFNEGLNQEKKKNEKSCDEKFVNDIKINYEENNKISKVMSIVGIDFGSTSSGYSIILDPHYDSKSIDINEIVSSQIIIHKLSQDGLFIGEDTSKYFNNNPDYLYFTLFKRYLNPKNHKHMVFSDFPGDKIELYIVLKEFLRKLKQKIEENNKRIESYKITEIKWIITVPPLWDIKGKKLMEMAAKKVGMINLDILLEPEATSIAIFNEDNQNIKKYIHPGKKFLIVDAGGYTVDFSANKILEDNNLEQLMIPISIVNGSSIFNDKKFQIVEKFF